eukprot:9494264-Pyramimonas_sp.AAC.2
MKPVPKRARNWGPKSSSKLLRTPPSSSESSRRGPKNQEAPRFKRGPRGPQTSRCLYILRSIICLMLHAICKCRSANIKLLASSQGVPEQQFSSHMGISEDSALEPCQAAKRSLAAKRLSG